MKIASFPLTLLFSLVLIGCSTETTKVEEKPRRNPDQRGPDLEYLKGAPAAPEDLAGPVGEAIELPEGIRSVILTASQSEGSPTATDLATIHYTGWTSDGQAFASTKIANEPEIFDLKHSITGLCAILKTMKIGESRRVWIPESQAYANRSYGPRGDLCYDIELVSFQPTPEGMKGPGPLTPEECKVPEDAIELEGGVKYITLKEGKGLMKPITSATVEVLYAGWTTDGKLFDTSKSLTHTFSLTKVIPGWRVMLPNMHKGQKVRVWIPPGAGYGFAPDDYEYDGASHPLGMLIFDIELISIQ